MRTKPLVAITAACGILVGIGLNKAYNLLDEGISHTYRCDQLGREADAIESARKILEQYIFYSTTSELETKISTAGLHLDKFDKGDYTIISASVDPYSAWLEFVATQNNIRISNFPKVSPCISSKLEGQ